MESSHPYRVLGLGPRRILRFLSVGALGTLLDLTLFALLHTWAGLPTLPANVLSYGAGILNNYLLHRRWTYGDRARKPTGVQFAQFLAVSLSALALNTTLVLLLAPPLGGLFGAAAAGSLAAKLVATAAGLGWNLLANHCWTFRTTPPKGADR